MQDQNIIRKISLLDWGIIISSLLLLLTIFLPQYIWQEEEKFRKEGRKRMSDIANAEDFYFEMTGHYTLDGEHLFKLVEAAMDSLIADSLFTGKKIINLGENTYPITLERGFEIRVDTTFSDPTEIYFSYDDTVYSIELHNLELGGTDTLFVNVRDLPIFQADNNFKKILSMDTVTRSEVRTDYLRKKYHLNNRFLFCPVTKDPYIFEIDSSGEESIFKITSPLHLLDTPYQESRFGVFKFKAGDHGYIHDGQTSWVE